MARRSLLGPARVRGLHARGGRTAQAEGAALCAPRPGGDVLRTGALGRVREGGAGVPRIAWPERGCVPRVPPRALLRRLARIQGTREGLHERGAERRGTAHEARRRLLPAAPDVPAHRRARASDRLSGTQAPRGRSPARQVRELTRERPLSQVERPLRPPPCPRGNHERGAGRRRRGEHRRDRAASGRVAAGRRVDGNGAHRAAAERAVAAHPADLPVLRLRLGRRGRDAPRDGARAESRASRSASSRFRKGRIRRTIRPASRPGSTRPRPMPSIASGSSSTAHGTSSTRTFVSRTFSTASPSRPSGTMPGSWRTTASASPFSCAGQAMPGSTPRRRRG